jgi:formate dehydrogenase subunit gamma
VTETAAGETDAEPEPGATQPQPASRAQPEPDAGPTPEQATRPEPAAESVTERTIVRFDVVTRVAHWLTAVLAGVLLITGSILYVPELEAMIGRREILATIHVWCGLLLFVPVLVGVVAGRAGRGLRADLVELGRWDDTDRRWLRRRTRDLPAGKFNGGQKLLAALLGGAFAAQLLTGALMNWNHPFPDDWRTGATFVHDWAYLAIVALVAGHILKALQDPDAMRGMVRGSVPETWARRSRPGWPARFDVRTDASRHE